MRKRISAVVLLLLALSGGAVLWLRTERVRLRSVVDDTIYRSGQLSPDQFASVVHDHRIRTVMNLRGPNPQHAWYVDEKRAANRLGVEHLDFRFQSYDWPPQHEVRRFVSALSTAQQPLLMHCESGSDRSGWASAIVRALQGKGIGSALEQLSVTNGHFCRRSKCGLHQFFAEYEKWLAREQRTGSGETFRHWTMNEYTPPPYDAAIDSLREVPRVAAAGSELPYLIRVRNDSYLPWKVQSDGGIRLGARIIGPFPVPPTDPMALFRTPNGPAKDLYRAPAADGSFEPGAAQNEEVALRAPAQRGHYVIQFDMVDEGVHWFSDISAAGRLMPLEVR